MLFDRIRKILDVSYWRPHEGMSLTAPTPTNHEIRQCVRYTLYNALARNAVAVQWFLDNAGEWPCVRLVVCVNLRESREKCGVAPSPDEFLQNIPVPPTDADKYLWFEAAPMPDYFLPAFTTWLGRLTRDGHDGMRVLRLRHDHNVREVLVRIVPSTDMCIYLDDSQPHTILQERTNE